MSLIESMLDRMFPSRRKSEWKQPSNPSQQHVYWWQTPMWTSDPEAGLLGPHFHNVFLDGELQTYVRWAVTGKQGVVCKYVRENNTYVKDETTCRAKYVILQGEVRIDRNHHSKKGEPT